MTVHIISPRDLQTLCGFKVLHPPGLFELRMPEGDGWTANPNEKGPVVCECCRTHSAANTMQPTYMRPMIQLNPSPSPSLRILLCHYVYHYENNRRRHGDWVRAPNPVWTMVRWVDKKAETGSDPHWEEYCGKDSIHSSHHIKPEDCLGWLPVPGEKEP